MDDRTVSEAKPFSVVRWDFLAFLLFVIALCFIAKYPLLGSIITFFAGMVVPTAVLAMIVYGKGNLRLFAVGAIIPSIVLLSQAVTIFVFATFEEWNDLDEFDGTPVSVPLLFALVPACGALAILIRRVVEWPQNREGEASSRPFQFSLRSMIIGTTLAAVACVIWVMLPRFSSSVILFSIMFLIVVESSIGLYLACTSDSKSASRWRVFALGASIPILMMLAVIVVSFVIGMFGSWRFIDDSDYNTGLKIGLPLMTALAFGGGRFSLWLHQRSTRTT